MVVLVFQSHHWKSCLVTEEAWFGLHNLHYLQSFLESPHGCQGVSSALGFHIALFPIHWFQSRPCTFSLHSSLSTWLFLITPLPTPIRLQNLFYLPFQGDPWSPPPKHSFSFSLSGSVDYSMINLYLTANSYFWCPAWHHKVNWDRQQSVSSATVCVGVGSWGGKNCLLLAILYLSLPLCYACEMWHGNFDMLCVGSVCQFGSIDFFFTMLVLPMQEQEIFFHHESFSVISFCNILKLWREVNHRLNMTSKIAYT